MGSQADYVKSRIALRRLADSRRWEDKLDGMDWETAHASALPWSGENAFYLSPAEIASATEALLACPVISRGPAV